MTYSFIKLKIKTMTNKTALKEEGNNKSKSVIKTQKKAGKKSTGFVPASVGVSAVDAVKARSSNDVRGGIGLSNTGTINSYD